MKGSKKGKMKYYPAEGKYEVDGSELDPKLDYDTEKKNARRNAVEKLHNAIVKSISERINRSDSSEEIKRLEKKLSKIKKDRKNYE